ncbi:hypothetical protein BDF21DRAFT_444319 [Thamnidium elegans]|uniref:CBS domain-containing protein n=1 Tax=Thamnidium elegans TaxID=101142 RepID=A0A8H7SHX8_9FUNG|nr:hypothetical protein INT48_001473 [Thamnidium elegans]KAI8080953.1 hypothetical protein BDF21DRAFT_444319 [Thamnidium elegans]
MTTILNNNDINLKNKDTFDQFIQSKNVGDVIQKVKPTYRDLLDLPSSSTMEEAFDFLLAEDISSVPIYHTDTQGVKEYIAIVSALDLLKLLSTKVSVETLQSNSDALLMPLSDTIGMTEKLCILKSSDSLDKLSQLFSFKRVHRVLIQQNNDTFVLLSQMDLIRFFQSFNHQLGSSVLDLSIKDIKHSGVRSELNYKSTAAEAFLKLAADDTISALPIVDDNSELIGEISAKDLRGLNLDRWDSLSKPVVMYLKVSHGDLYRPLTCHDGFTLSQIMTAFVLRKAYRLWWTDMNTGELKGVITLTDILSTFASHH